LSVSKFFYKVLELFRHCDFMFFDSLYCILDVIYHI
jgi:hypothetical protein